MSLIVATWIGAIGTVVLAVGAIVTSIFAVLAFRKQSREVALLQKQVEGEQEETRREAESVRRAQAARVYMTVHPDRGSKGSSGNDVVAGRGSRRASATIRIHNTSDQPVYDVRVHWVCGTPAVQAGTEGIVGTLGPQDEKHVKREVPDTVALDQFGPVVFFRDAAGARWTLLPEGELEPVPAELGTGAPLIATLAADRRRTSLWLHTQDP